MSPAVVGENESGQGDQRPSEGPFPQSGGRGELFEGLPETRAIH